MTARVMSGGKYLRTYSSPAPPPSSALHKTSNGTLGNTSSRNALESPAAPHERDFALPPPRRFARFCLRTKVQSSKRSCSCHQIRCDCKFSSWQFFEPRPRVVVGQQDGVIKRVLYLFTPPPPHPTPPSPNYFWAAMLFSLYQSNTRSLLFQQWEGCSDGDIYALKTQQQAAFLSRFSDISEIPITLTLPKATKTKTCQQMC